jgi:hypothetical protein
VAKDVQGGVSDVGGFGDVARTVELDSGLEGPSSFVFFLPVKKLFNVLAPSLNVGKEIPLHNGGKI